ncbi:hypothetical protein L528_2199 [Bordetella bronchiseptica MBORD849]|nr:hypothetical protein L528_2199 [Bordetella bronchiseptica MBORD849]
MDNGGIMEVSQAPKRPLITDEMVIDVARKHYPNGQEAEQIAECFHRLMDGYELARTLDRDCGWECSREDVDTLDEVIWNVGTALADAERAWVIAYDIQPSHDIGARVSFYNGRKGVITAIAGAHSPACYLVKEDGCDDETEGNKRYVVKFEEATFIE